jgi:hypothetical protein
MIVTLGQAWNLSWRIHVRCLDDAREGLKHKKPCGYKKFLDLETLVVCTRGRAFPIARIAERLRCPRCGCRQMSVCSTRLVCRVTGDGEMRVMSENENASKSFRCSAKGHRPEQSCL